MTSAESRARAPQDLVAIFHASFHPTQGNVVDWSVKASQDLSLEHLEFSALPSGLHLVEQDVVYFTKDGHHGVCIYRRRQTTEHGHRGFRLSSLGILLAKSVRPRPWRHTSALKDLVTSIYAKLENRGVLEPTESDWDPARAFFAERQVKRADLGGAGDWNGWSRELDEPESDLADVNPTVHLPHLIRILGPSVLTLYKHVLGRRRILIYTLPPVEAACILCQVAADLCFDDQLYTDPTTSDSSSSNRPSRLRGKSREGINVLGMVTLNDVDRMVSEGKSGRGWIACTTDAIFLDKASCYDLIIDLTTSTPNKASRPAFYVSRPILPRPPRGSTHRLSVIRFAWSDVNLWTELDRILQLDTESSEHNGCCGPSSSASTKSRLVTTWTDAWRVYEDVCIICAGLWMGSWRGNSTMSYSTANGSNQWGSVQLEGDEDLSLGGYVRNLGRGIEGRPVGSGSSSSHTSGGISSADLGLSPPASPTKTRRASAISWSSGKATLAGPSNSGKRRQLSLSSALPESAARRERQILTTLALLQTFHANTCFQLSQLGGVLQRSGDVVYLTPKDVLAFELGPLSTLDARYLEWLVEEYGRGVRVVVKHGWKDLFGLVFGYG